MATTQQVRQSQLFAAEDWQVIYTAFSQVNFNAYDFPTIRSAMVNYIRLNYPEDFNDWIESSEFVALIDLLAYLGQSLAFRMDLNTRENFLETATRRDSVFRLARMLSYQPQRSIPASGLLKITSIVTDQPVYDSNGQNLQNISIVWNDQNNPDWYEQFILVMNATLNPTNPFGNPTSSGIVNGIPTSIYEMNNTSIPSSVIPFTANVTGNTINMELANANFNSGSTVNLTNAGNFYEIDPDPLNSWNVIYQNDGNGYASANTGFFLYFKQGTMGFQDYLCSSPIANRIIDVNADNVNQTDIWVQTINTNGLVTTKWSKVQSVNGFNVIYNSLDNNVRNIFSVLSRDNNGSDQISVRFADGGFGNVPLGIIRVWYRSSNNLTYQIRPSDISNQVFAFSYVDNLNNTWNVAFNTNLQYTVNNAQSSENNFQIAQNAPQVYYTQDRMVNGEDYNLFPLQDNRILKVKAVNRYYSGQSRYLDANDPTGSYNDLNVFCSDGIFYNETDLNSTVISNSAGINLTVLVNTKIQPLINGSLNEQTSATELENFYYYNYPRKEISNSITWKTITSSTTSCTGAFYIGVNAIQIGNSAPTNSILNVQYIQQGSLVIFQSGIVASIVGITGDGTGVNLTGSTNGITVGTTAGPGAVTLSTPIVGSDVPVEVIPSFNTTLSSSAISSIVSALSLQKPFGIRYDQISSDWVVISTENLNSDGSFSMTYAGDISNTNKDNSWLLLITWTGSGWKINSRSLRYIFESASQNRFYFENFEKTYDPNTGAAEYDYINILGVNPSPQFEMIQVTASSLVASNTTITLADTTGIRVGQIVIGLGIPSNTTVIGVTSTTITISNAISISGTNVALVFYQQPGLGKDYLWKITGQQIDPDGYADPTSVRVTMWEGTNTGVPADPDEFNNIVNPSLTPSLLLFWRKDTSSDGYQYWTPITIPLDQIFQNASDVPPVTVFINNEMVVNPYWVPGKLIYVINQEIFYQYTSVSVSTVGTLNDVTANYKMRIGRNNLSFLWKHYAPTDQRINPAVTNVIDMYVLTSAYDTDLRNWISTNGSSDTLPQPPARAELAANFSNFNRYSMMTDTMVWHPVSYKLLFGSQAPAELQATFLVVPAPGTTYTNNQIQTLVIQAVNQYFNLSNWDFGASFFFTELGAYIHQQLISIVGSVVILPVSAQSKFGDLFEITCNPDEIPISCATVNNVQIVPSLTETILGIQNSNG
jgi:hypothetical protein